MAGVRSGENDLVRDFSTFSTQACDLSLVLVNLEDILKIVEFIGNVQFLPLLRNKFCHIEILKTDE